jgi:hypothetical protein
MVYRPCDLYESDSSPCDINHQKDYTAWTSYDKNNFLLLFIHLNKALQKFSMKMRLEASDNHAIYLSHWISKLLRILG